jgi:hypothetical protein
MSKFDSSGKLIRNKSINFFHKLHITTTSFSDHKVSWDFNSQGLSLLVESFNSSDVIQYSFDGNEVHGDLTPGLPSAGIVFDTRHANKIWLRRVVGGYPVLVRIESWRSQL